MKNINAKRFLSYATPLFGSAISGVLGVAADGQITATAAGSALGALITTCMNHAIDDYSSRQLSVNETARASAAARFAICRINDNLRDEKKVREDFFRSHERDRPAAEELFEGIMRRAQDAYEEKKVEYLGNLFANFLFDETITTQEANSLIYIAGSLTYRQFCILSMLLEKHNGMLFELSSDDYENAHLDSCLMSILQEIYALHSNGLVVSSEDEHSYLAVIGLESIRPAFLKLTKLGLKMSSLLELGKIRGTERDAIVTSLKFIPVQSKAPHHSDWKSASINVKTAVAVL